MKILYNIKAFVMDKDGSRANAVAWKNGRIIGVGEKNDLIRAHTDATLLDGQGLTLVPAFIDPHIHFMDGTVFHGALDCSPGRVSDLSALKSLLKKKAARHEKGQWIVAQGYDPWAWPDKKTPTRHDLDQACPDNPVVVVHYSFHECAANSMALATAGIDRHFEPPFAGIIKRDGRGNPTGHLIETAMAKVMHLAKKGLILQDKDRILQGIGTFQEKLFELGITRIADPAVDNITRGLYQQAWEQGILKSKVFMFPCNENSMFKLPKDKVEQPFDWDDNDLLKTGPLKFFLDGADRAAMVLSPKQFAITCAMIFCNIVRSRSLTQLKAAMRSPVTLKKNVYLGLVLVDVDKCRALVSKAVEKDLGLAFHAIGNHAVRLAVQLINKAPRPSGYIRRPRIEHALFLTDDLIGQIRKCGAAIVTQPGFLTHMDKDNLPYLPGIKKMPLRSMIDQGIHVAGSSDFPVVSCDPLLGIRHAVTRMTKGREILDRQEAISIEQAFAMYTRQAAYVLECLDETGTLEPGKQADFILLSGDPFGNSRICWDRVKVQQTYMNGEMVFSRSKTS